MIDPQNPIDDPDFNIYAARRANPHVIDELITLAMRWRVAREEAANRRARLNAGIVHAKDTGHSYRQIREATGLGTAAIQMVLGKAGRI